MSPKVDPFRRARAERLLRQGWPMKRVASETGLATNTVRKMNKAIAAESKKPDADPPRPS